MLWLKLINFSDHFQINSNPIVEFFSTTPNNWHQNATHTEITTETTSIYVYVMKQRYVLYALQWHAFIFEGNYLT